MTWYSLNSQLKKLVKTALDEKQPTEQSDDTLKMIDEPAKSQDFFQSNKGKIERKYTTRRIKSRKFLPNIAYVGINIEDFYNENFIFDVYLLITKNLNPFSLDRKLTDKNKHEILYVLWKECMPQKFYEYTCKENNFFSLNGKNVLQPKVAEIINDYSNEIKLPRNEKQLITL